MTAFAMRLLWAVLERLSCSFIGDELCLRHLPCRDGPVILTTPPFTDIERGWVAFCSTIGCFQHICTCHFDAVWQALFQFAVFGFEVAGGPVRDFINLYGG
jgi:hypothetical protein